MAIDKYDPRSVVVGGGVVANSHLRESLDSLGNEYDLPIYIPKLEYCSDNAAMIAITGYYKYKTGDFAGLDSSPLARLPM